MLYVKYVPTSLGGGGGGGGTTYTIGALDGEGTPSADALTITGSVLYAQSASATAPGMINTSAQTIAGAKTLTGLLNANGGIDRSTAGTLTIGATNSTTINIGNAGAVVNIQGTTIYENTPILQVADPLITVNHGGGAGSGQNSGIEVEENNVVTGYNETSSDRNSWILKAPNTAGVVTITPGASGFVIDQASHNALTLAAVGSSPNANGASLSTQVLNLQPADGTNPGVLTAGAQTIGGQKTFSTGLTGTLTGAASLNVLTSALGSLTDAGTDGIVVTGGTGAVVGSVSLAQHVADTTHNGYLSSTDWNTFNGKGAGSVTSVGLSVPGTSIFGVTGSPVSGSGTLGLTTTGTSGGIPYFSSSSQLATSAALTINQLILGGGAGAAPSALAAGSQYQVLVMGASNPGYGQVNLAQSAAITGVLPIANGGTGSATVAAATFFAGPTSGSNAAPSFRALQSPTIQTFAAAPTGSTNYSFTITSGNTASVGAVYTNNGQSFTLIKALLVGDTILYASGTGTPATSGTLTYSSGTHTGGNITFSAFLGAYVLPSSPSPLYIRARMVGGGGGGGGGGSTVAAQAGSGGNSTFGTTLLVANGGTGGAAASGTDTAGGTASLGSGPIGTALTGGRGSAGIVVAGSVNFFTSGGSGGANAFGGAGGGANNGAFAVNPGGGGAANTGGGGGGGSGPNSSSPSYGGGGGGAGGFLDALITSPSTHYSYAVGAAGTAGVAGTSGGAGGAGGSGYIEITEYYQ